MMNSTGEENNGSAYYYSYNGNLGNSKTVVIINCVSNVPLMLISISGNALVMVAIKGTSSIRSTSTIMVCSLAFSDFLVGLVDQPLYIGHQLTKESTLLILEGTIGHSVCGVSFLTITAISLDRFVALHYHLRYYTLVNKFRVRCTAGIIWCVSFLAVGFYFWNKRLYRVILGLTAVICLVISTFSYVGIYRIVRRHQSQIHSQQRAVQCISSGNNLLRLRRSAVNTFIFYIVLILCYFPFFVFITLNGVFNQSWKTEWNFSATVVFINSSINPFLYCWRFREVRAAVLKTTRKLLRKENE